MRRHAFTLSLALLTLAVSLGAARAAYRVESRLRPPSFRAVAPAEPQETRIEIIPLARGRTSVHVRVRKGTVRHERDSVADSTLQTLVPATLILSRVRQ